MKTFGYRKRYHLWTDMQSGRRQSHLLYPFTLDPCRGWGRNPSARIRVQKEPVVSPAGTGNDYRSTPKGLQMARVRQDIWGLFGGNKKSTTRFIKKFRGEYLHVALAGSRDRHTLQKGDACWEPRMETRKTHPYWLRWLIR